ncbi:MAG: hypothetical protein IIA40_07135, partial [SAR324 cluster bacterium]|nr:hypothetical protein [SAR324 cluster bacterium]
MKSSLSPLGLFGAILLAVGLAVGWTLPALAAGDPNAVVTQRVPQAMTTVFSYWTPERMAAAKPMLLPRVPRDQAPATRSAPAAPTGPMVLAYPGGPGDTPREERIPHSELTTQEPVPETGTYPWAFTSYQAFPNLSVLYQQFPYKLVGKVFFTIPGLGDFVCSGSVVNAPNNSLVWTAGHCVYT